MICISTTSDEYRLKCTVGWQSTSLIHAVISPIIPMIRAVKTCAILLTLPVKCASVVPRCSTHHKERSPLSRRAVFSYGLAKASRVASGLYKTLLGESRGPDSLQVLKCPALSRSQQTLKSLINEFKEFRGLLCLK